MAYYVLIRKEAEDDDRVVYQFGPNENQLGRLSFDKRSGVAEEIEAVPVEQKHQFFVRAAAKIHQHWLKGSLPERTSWSS